MGVHQLPLHLFPPTPFLRSSYTTKKAFEAFEEAWKIAKESLKATHPIRLSLAREFAGFLKCTDNLSEAVTMLIEAQGKALPLLAEREFKG